MDNMKKTELNSIYGVMASKYIDTDLNSIYPNNDFVVSLDTICDKLTGKLHAEETYRLNLLDNLADVSINNAEDSDSCFHYMALEAHHCHDEVIRTIFEISNLLIPFCMRYGETYNHFLKELIKAKETSRKMFNSIGTIEDYFKFAKELRKELNK